MNVRPAGRGNDAPSSRRPRTLGPARRRSTPARGSGRASSRSDGASGRRTVMPSCGRSRSRNVRIKSCRQRRLSASVRARKDRGKPPRSHRRSPAGTRPRRGRSRPARGTRCARPATRTTAAGAPATRCPGPGTGRAGASRSARTRSTGRARAGAGSRRGRRGRAAAAATIVGSASRARSRGSSRSKTVVGPARCARPHGRASSCRSAAGRGWPRRDCWPGGAGRAAVPKIGRTPGNLTMKSCRLALDIHGIGTVQSGGSLSAPSP